MTLVTTSVLVAASDVVVDNSAAEAIVEAEGALVYVTVMKPVEPELYTGLLPAALG
jgi:hypothetical protein